MYILHVTRTCIHLERALNRRELVVEAYSLLLEPLDDLLVRFVDALRLVVLDHCLVQAVLQRPDIARQRRVVVPQFRYILF